MSEITKETAKPTDEKIEYLGSAVLLPGSFPDESKNNTSFAGPVGEQTTSYNRPSDLKERDQFEGIPKRLHLEIIQFLQRNKLKTTAQSENPNPPKSISQLAKMRPIPHHDEEWEEAVEFGDEPALVLARCGEYCGQDRYRAIPWIYCPGDSIPSFDLLNLDQLHRLRKKLYIQENGLPPLRAPPDEFWLIRRQLGVFIRKFRKIVLDVLKPEELTNWDPICDLLTFGPSPKPY
ncbi:hypothetical protein AJ78_04621 [Emergomyces pasteurianus Ep9510]|uniref:Uncharacterized protein n=1 Tax=Emergomyces pasteurianus Ep9510 TaxID=1447872 RepID=A0A1J9PF47_9EURO|nr:hypothetical protein AJ78_04621 [Emergomyces pasteurianus Ep9510]